MTSCRAGDVALVRFPFTDLSATKQRPVVVLSPAAFISKHGDVSVMAMTSQPQLESGTLVERWREAGLLKPTWLKPLVGTLASSLVVKVIGQLPSEEWHRVEDVLRLMIAAQFRARW